MKIKLATWQQFASLLTCLLMLLAVAINKSQRVLGTELKSSNTEEYKHEPLRQMSDGTIVIATESLTKDIMGYGGTVPLEISIKDGKVSHIEALKNAETPDFFNKMVAAGVLAKWDGTPLEDALRVNVDAVSGATLSSDATIASIRRGLQYAQNAKIEEATDLSPLLSLKSICALAVIFMAAFLPSFVRFKHYRIIQLVLNVAVLGFWSGSFISYSLLVNFLSNGLNVWASLVPLSLVIIAFVFPLFGKKGHYCAWTCPLGSLQELAGKSVKRKLPLSPKLVKYLNYFREALWAVLMLLMWTGVFFEWMNYELFTAFLFQQASVAVIAVTILFVLLSCVVTRPYCRFVCPTGNLLRLSQNTK